MKKKDEPKKDLRPSTAEWFQTVLRIKEFGEAHDLGLTDTQYSWLATLFYELREQEGAKRPKNT